MSMMMMMMMMMMMRHMQRGIDGWIEIEMRTKNLRIKKVTLVTPRNETRNARVKDGMRIRTNVGHFSLVCVLV